MGRAAYIIPLCTTIDADSPIQRQRPHQAVSPVNEKKHNQQSDGEETRATTGQEASRRFSFGDIGYYTTVAPACISIS